MKSHHKVVAATIVAVAFSLALLVPAGRQLPVAHAQVSASTQIFLALPGVEGSVSMKGFEKQIELTAATVGVSRPAGSLGGKGTNKPVPTDLTISKRVDGSSPQLYVSAASGSRYPTAVLTVVSGGNSLVYKLGDVSIVSYQGSTSQGAMPTEALALSYGKLEIEAKTTTAKGSAKATQGGYDFVQGKSL